MSGGETEIEAEVSRLSNLVERLTLRVVNLEDRLREVEELGGGERSGLTGCSPIGEWDLWYQFKLDHSLHRSSRSIKPVCQGGAG